MSQFSIEKRIIKEVFSHPNADRLELTTVVGLGYQFVTGKGEFKTGDWCIYFPIDSVLPKILSDFLNVTSFLSGKEHNRIKTVKLRNCISQGLAVQFKKIDEFLQIQGMNNMPIINEDYAPILGVTKYEPPAILEKGGNLVRLPEGVESYDIEGCDNFPQIVENLMDKIVYISEKLEGSNHGVTIMADGTIIVNQHNYAIEPIDGVTHTWIKIAKDCGVIEFVEKLQKNEFLNKQITIRSEILGGKIQGNIYKLDGYTLRIYDIEVDGKYLDYNTYIGLIKKYNMINYNVPVLSDSINLRNWLNGKTIQMASNGKSLLNPDILREGIVIRPIEEQYVRLPKFQGRLILKMRSPEYLSNEK